MDYFDVLFAKTNGISSSTCYNEIEAMLEATVGHSSKNLLKITKNSDSVNGVDFTVDKVAGTITANGTASGQAQFSIRLNNIPSGNYYFSGCADNGSSEKYDVYAYDITTNKRMKQWDGSTASLSDYGGTSQEIKVISTNTQQITIRIHSGVTVSNAVFRLMLRDGSISDDTFEPYVTPTDEKKQDNPVVLWEAALNSTGVSEVPLSSLADNVSNYSYLKVVVTNELGSTITDQDAIMANVEYDPTYIGQNVGQSAAILGFHEVDEHLVYDRLFIWVVSDGINISVVGLRDHNETSDAPDTVSGVFIRKIIGIPK